MNFFFCNINILCKSNKRPKYFGRELRNALLNYKIAENSWSINDSFPLLHLIISAQKGYEY